MLSMLFIILSWWFYSYHEYSNIEHFCYKVVCRGAWAGCIVGCGRLVYFRFACFLCREHADQAASSHRGPIIRSFDVTLIMMTSSNGNIFSATGPLYGEFTGHRWIPLTKASNAELWCFIWSVSEQTLSKQSRRRWLEMPLHSLWRHCNGSLLSTQSSEAPLSNIVHR